MTCVELRFSFNGTPPNTPEFRSKFYNGNAPTDLLSADTAGSRVSTVVTRDYVAVRVDECTLADLSATTEDNIVTACENMAGVAHMGTYEVDN